MFGSQIDYVQVSIWRRKFFPFQPRNVTMAPRGHMHFHPQGQSYCDDFAHETTWRQGHFIHEMTHIWQVQRNGRWFLLLRRMPWAPYHYSLRPGWTLEKYGLEQQAELVRHAFLLRAGHTIPGAPPLEQYLAIFPHGFFPTA